MNLKLVREILALNKDLTVKESTNSFILYALLGASEQKTRQRVKEILEFHVASGEFQGSNAVVLRDALRTASLFCE
jgi:hypothetical protein